MRAAALALLVLANAVGLAAMGFSEDPGEVQARTYDLSSLRELTVRGQITLVVHQGERPSLRVSTTRALFDQLRVFSWFGFTSVAVETGLLGPREAGNVEVEVTATALEHLTVLDHSTAVVDWPGESATVTLRDGSSLDLSFTGTRLRLDANSKVRVQLTGRTDDLDVQARHGSRITATDFAIGVARLEFDEASTGLLGAVASWSGTLRHGSQATATTVPRGDLASD